MKRIKNGTYRLAAAMLAALLMLTAAAPALAETFSAIVTSDSMTVYSNAALSKKQTTLSEDAVVKVTSYSGNVARINYSGRTGYAKISDMKRVDEVATKAVAAAGTKVYQAPSAKARSVSIKEGTRLYVLDTSGEWAQVERNGVVGYLALSSLIQVDASWQPMAVTDAPADDSAQLPKLTVKQFDAKATSSAPVYKSNDTASEKLGTLPTGQVVTVGAYSSDGWAYIRLNGKYGYVQYKYLTPVTDEEPEVVTPVITPAPTLVPAAAGKVSVASLPVYRAESAKSTKLGTLKKGQQVNVISWNKTWAYIELNGKFGYCAVKGLSKATVEPTPTPSALDPVPAAITAATLPVYKEADTSSKKLGTMKLGQTLNVIQLDGEWAYVELNGRYGYCKAAGVSMNSSTLLPTPTPAFDPTATPSTDGAVKGTVKAATLPVYKTASTSGTKLGTLKKGQVVNVIKWNSSWAYIELSGHYGFCAVSGLTKAEATPTAAPTAVPSLDKAVKATVSADTVAVYQLASAESTKLGTLMWGADVNVLSLSGEWAYIELNGRYGFCKASALTRADDDVDGDYQEGGFTATVVDPAAVAYANPDVKSQSVKLTLGENVDVYAYNGDWACVTRGASRAFVPIKQLSRTTYATISADGADLQTLLKALLSYGYYDGVPGTTYNSAAVTAIKRFQAACGLNQTGVADQTTQRILYGGAAPACSILNGAISTSSDTATITRLQTRLLALGYLSKSSSVDGDYGTITANAVSMFQTLNGIKSTGKADAATVKKLYSVTASAISSKLKAADANTGSSSGGSSGSVVSPTGTVKLSSTYVTTMPAALKSNTSSYSAGMSSAQKLEHVIYSAQQKLGCTYVYGATGPNTFDCSGLTQYSFKKVSVSLKRSAYSQGYDSSYTKISSVGSLRRGDLVFFNTISDSDQCDHVGIYLGGGCFIHASSGGHKVVVSNITSGYYNRVFSWGRRILS